MGLAETTNIDSALASFSGAEIAIRQGTRSAASRSQQYLRQILRSKQGSDNSFPELLTVTDEDFLGGSFARHTKIWPLDDIDLFVPLDGGTLIYTDGGIKLPFSLATDSGTTRLTQSKWMDGFHVSSRRVLDGFRDALSTTYSRSEVSVDEHCVKLGTTIAATNDSDGIGFDIVPCFLLHPDDRSEDFYLVPNGSGGWMRTNPRKDTTLCAALHSFHNLTFRKAVRLLKYWNATQISGAIQSYYIELALLKRFDELRSSQSVVASTLQAFAIAFAALKSAIDRGALVSLVTDAPDVPAPNLSDEYRAILQTDSANAVSCFSIALKEHSETRARDLLNAIFNSEFF